MLTRPALARSGVARLLIAGTGGGTVGVSGTGVRGPIGTGVADEGIGLAHAQRAVIAFRAGFGVGVEQGA
ncbi:hypothetical protein [Microbispora rosea]|uniref:hypothetical protein n=1 Tax=Microbispora rosea TaxID=58117 RepID=UPI0004C47524|nr:hypothetical protein [Microbispora rosea]